MIDGLHAFAFQTGSWKVRHRKLRDRLVGSADWLEFGGTCTAWEILGGAGNVEDNWLDDPNGAYTAAAVRRMDAATGQWSIWWIDSRFPDMDDPVHGRFQNGIGTFRGRGMLGDKPIDVRFIWSAISGERARWEQAFSDDGAITWETNWFMEFERVR